MRYLYSLLVYLCIPLILIRLLWKSRGLKGFNNLSERFALQSLKPSKPIVWLHAVSVGEVIASTPLVKAINKNFPEYQILITCMTPTGLERAKALFDDEVLKCFVPYDLPDVMARFLNKLNPQAVIIMETEIWPNLLASCAKRQIPVLLANARLSERSAKKYARFPKSTATMLQQISIVAAQSQADGDRFVALGASEDNVIITGSIKFDQQIPASTEETAALFRSLWGNDRPIWLAASTHEGEEELVLEAFNKILAQVPDALLILVPRHPQRFSKVESLAQKCGYQTLLRSSNQACDNNIKIVIGDSMGELCAYYAASDLAFVGGSLVSIGGHNLLEPAALGVAAITGPYVFNFTEITEKLLAANAIKKIDNREQLASCVIAWLNDGAARRQAGEQGRQVVEQNRGAVGAHITILKDLITH